MGTRNSKCVCLIRTKTRSQKQLAFSESDLILLSVCLKVPRVLSTWQLADSQTSVADVPFAAEVFSPAKKHLLKTQQREHSPMYSFKKKKMVFSSVLFSLTWTMVDTGGSGAEGQALLVARFFQPVSGEKGRNDGSSCTGRGSFSWACQNQISDFRVSLPPSLEWLLLRTVSRFWLHSQRKTQVLLFLVWPKAHETKTEKTVFVIKPDGRILGEYIYWDIDQNKPVLRVSQPPAGWDLFETRTLRIQSLSVCKKRRFSVCICAGL